jgi:hypothetical protein
MPPPLRVQILGNYRCIVTKAHEGYTDILCIPLGEIGLLLPRTAFFMVMKYLFRDALE